MGTYYIPRNYGGEGKFLYIFSLRSFITTGIGAAFGLIGYFIFTVIMKFQYVGIICVAICGAIGFALGTIKIPTIAGIPLTKKIGGESIPEIIVRYIKFKKNKCIYTFVDTKEEE